MLLDTNSVTLSQYTNTSVSDFLYVLATITTIVDEQEIDHEQCSPHRLAPANKPNWNPNPKYDLCDMLAATPETHIHCMDKTKYVGWQLAENKQVNPTKPGYQSLILDMFAVLKM